MFQKSLCLYASPNICELTFFLIFPSGATVNIEEIGSIAVHLEMLLSILYMYMHSLNLLSLFQPWTLPAYNTLPIVSVLQRLACPTYPYWFLIKHVELKACVKNTDCSTGEISCWWGEDQRCKTAIDTTPRPGNWILCESITLDKLWLHKLITKNDRCHAGYNYSVLF